MKNARATYRAPTVNIAAMILRETRGVMLAQSCTRRATRDPLAAIHFPRFPADAVARFRAVLLGVPHPSSRCRPQSITTRLACGVRMGVANETIPSAHRALT